MHADAGLGASIVHLKLTSAPAVHQYLYTRLHSHLSINRIKVSLVRGHCVRCSSTFMISFRSLRPNRLEVNFEYHMRRSFELQ